MEDASATANPAKLFVGNLAYRIDDTKLQEIFAPYGEIVEAVVLKEKQYGHIDRPPRSRGMGFVTYASSQSAQEAIAALNEKEVEGRAIIVEVAKPPKAKFNQQRI